jgi:hypothetical protein
MKLPDILQKLELPRDAHLSLTMPPPDWDADRIRRLAETARRGHPLDAFIADLLYARDADDDKRKVRLLPVEALRANNIICPFYFARLSVALAHKQAYAWRDAPDRAMIQMPLLERIVANARLADELIDKIMIDMRQLDHTALFNVGGRADEAGYVLSGHNHLTLSEAQSTLRWHSEALDRFTKKLASALAPKNRPSDHGSTAFTLHLCDPWFRLTGEMPSSRSETFLEFLRVGWCALLPREEAPRFDGVARYAVKEFKAMGR